jgi:MFS family permease
VKQEPKEKHDPYAALRVRDFRLFVTARFFLTLGIQVQSLIVGWQIYKYTEDPLWLGMIGLTEAVPFLFLVLFAGHVVDIVSRKKIIMLGTTALVLSSIALTFFAMKADTLLADWGVLPLFLTIFITGVARAFLGPSFFAFIAQLVPRELYSSAATWNSTVWHVAAATGLALGGLLYSFFSLLKDTGYDAFTLTYMADIGLVLTSLIIFAMVKSRPVPVREKHEPMLNSVGEGIRFVFRNQVMLGALSLDLFAVFFGGAVAMIPVFVDKVLYVPEEYGAFVAGMLRACPAIGALIMAIVMAYYPPLKNAGRNLLMSVAAFGLCIIIFGISTNIYLSATVLALSGAFDNVSVVVRHTILQLMTPDHMRGRVAAVNSVFIGSSNEIGEFESGVAARLLGLVPSVIFGGSVTMLVVGITARFAPKLKKLNLEEVK